MGLNMSSGKCMFKQKSLASIVLDRCSIQLDATPA
jgi:hypothetical protein